MECWSTGAVAHNLRTIVYGFVGGIERGLGRHCLDQFVQFLQLWNVLVPGKKYPQTGGVKRCWCRGIREVCVHKEKLPISTLEE